MAGGFAWGRRLFGTIGELLGVNWDRVWVRLASVPTRDDEAVMNGAPRLVVGEPQILRGWREGLRGDPGFCAIGVVLGVNWDRVWVRLASAPNRDDEAVMNGAPRLVVGEPQILRGRRE